MDDVTIPDNSILECGSKHTKTWLIKNSGKVAWPKTINVVKLSQKNKKVGSADGASIEIIGVEPGQECKVSVDVTIPAAPGKYRTADYSLAFDGRPFGDRFWAIVKAKNNLPKADSKEKLAQSSEAENKLKLPKDSDLAESLLKYSKEKEDLMKKLGAAFVRDVTLEDGTEVLPGKALTKTWEVKNTGEIAWPAGCKLVPAKGYSLGSEEEVDVKGVLPGETVHISVQIQAPEALGKYEARYQLSLASGKTFGHQYWAIIKVVAPEVPAPSQEKPKDAVSAPSQEKPEKATAPSEDLPSAPVNSKEGKEAFVDAMDLRQKAKNCKEMLDELLRNPKLLQETAKLSLADPSFMATMQQAPFFIMSALAGAPPKAKEISGMTKSDVAEVKTPVKPHEAETPSKPASTVEIVSGPCSPYKHSAALATIESMGFKQIGSLKKLLNKHKGNVDAVLEELFN